jgi:hypothetical protein
MFLVDVQAHYSIPGELVQGGQLLAMHLPTAETVRTITDAFVGGLSIAAGETVLVQGGRIAGDIAMTGGSLILSDATIDGSVDIRGGVFQIESSAIKGNLQIHDVPDGPASRVCGAAVGGNLHIQNNAVAVRIGSPQTGCPGNTVEGPALAMNNAGPVEVSGNKIRVALQCRNNAAIAGKDNQAKQKLGQCADY